MLLCHRTLFYSNVQEGEAMEQKREIALKIRDIRKVYRIGKEKVVALNKINLDIYQGEICCILGPSGSGKSTLLNMMAGLEKPTKGHIWIKGQKMTIMNEKQLAKLRQLYIGFIFQSYNLLSSLTAIENVSLPLMFRRVGKNKREKEAKSMLKAVGLKKYIFHKPTQMSGGQQQRVGIARAFMGTPAIVFADEPTGNLDSKTSRDVMKIMIEMVRKNSQSLIIVTHDREIAKFADKIVNILDGDIESVVEQDAQSHDDEDMN